MCETSLPHDSIHRQAFQLGQLLRFGVKTPKRVAAQNQRGRDVQDVISAKALFDSGDAEEEINLVF